MLKLYSTQFGKRTIALNMLFLFFLGVFFLAIETGQRGGETLFSNLILTIPFLLANVCAVLGLIYGLRSIITQSEQAIIVILAVLFDMLITFFFVTELLFQQ